MYAHDEFEPDHTSSPTDTMIQDLSLYGYRPAAGEADPRITPEDQVIQTAVADIFDALISTMADTSLDFDLDEVLWSTVNTFHRAAERIETKLDDNEQAQKRLQREQDGSEVKSVQLETLIDIGQGLIDRRESMELFRETAADLFLKATGTHWSPRSGSRTSHRHLTAAMIDSRDFIAAKKRAETESLVPPGPKVAFSGGDTTDHRLIWDRLDQIHSKHPDMVLLHGGSPKGAERCRRSPSSRTGPNTPRPHPSSATTRCWTACRSVSWFSRAPASRTTWPTRPARWASRSTAWRRAARKRCLWLLAATSCHSSPGSMLRSSFPEAGVRSDAQHFRVIGDGSAGKRTTALEPLRLRVAGRSDRSV